MTIRMQQRRLPRRRTLQGLLAAALAVSWAFIPLPAGAQSGHPMLGGARGVVRARTGQLLEGMMVQLISQKSAVRTTVFSDADGRFEFPKLESGTYTLRIARPREYHPYVKESVSINGAPQLEDIVLERVTASDLLPPHPMILAQMTGSEWLMSLSGTGEDKRRMTIVCNFCHSYQQIFRNRYDKESWRKIAYRMLHGAGSPLINLNQRGRLPADEEEKLVDWLASVRGPDSPDPKFVTLPRPQGRATRVIITEYELPRLELATHDVWGDSKGYVWYSPHRSSYFGRLDPKTGAVKEFHVPVTPGSLPGTHWLFVNKDDSIYLSENWAHNMVRFDSQTGEISKVAWPTRALVNSPMGGNYSVGPDGTIWKVADNRVIGVDPKTGTVTRELPTKKFRGTYGSAVSKDGRFFGGGAWPADGVVFGNLETGEVIELDSSPNSGPARGDFDPEGNLWSAGRGGMLVKSNPVSKRVWEYPLPTPYVSLYQAMPDKNGEVWGGELQGGQYFRFNPRTQTWTEYMLPEPHAHDRKSWVDNSTNPVTVWYVDHDGWIVRLQPLQ